MMIVFDKEVKEILTELKKADGYLDCENVILTNLKKHAANGVSIAELDGYLKNLLEYVEDKTVINKGTEDYTNLIYAGGFLRTITSTPYWHSWIK